MKQGRRLQARPGCKDVVIGPPEERMGFGLARPTFPPLDHGIRNEGAFEKSSQKDLNRSKSNARSVSSVGARARSATFVRSEILTAPNIEGLVFFFLLYFNSISFHCTTRLVVVTI